LFIDGIQVGINSAAAGCADPYKTTNPLYKLRHSRASLIWGDSFQALSCNLYSNCPSSFMDIG